MKPNRKASAPDAALRDQLTARIRRIDAERSILEAKLRKLAGSAAVIKSQRLPADLREQSLLEFCLILAQELQEEYRAVGLIEEAKREDSHSGSGGSGAVAVHLARLPVHPH